MPVDPRIEKIAKIILEVEAKGAEEAAKSTFKFSKAISGLEKSAKSLLGPVQKLAGLVGGGLGFSKSIGFVQDYYKALTSLSAQMNKYGMGAKSLESTMSSLSSTLHLTKMETIGLMSEFEKGFPVASAKSFEKIMVNVQRAVGSNAEAIKEMAGNLGQLAMIYPGLQGNMENLTKLDKDRLNRSLELLQTQKQMSLTQVRGIQDYISQNEQMSQSDKDHLKNWKEFQSTMQNIKAGFESIAIVLGESFAPLIKSISQYMTENKDTIKEWVKYIGQAAATIGPILIGLKAISGMGEGFKAMGGLFGGGAGNCGQAKKCAAAASKTFWSKKTLGFAVKF